MLLEAVAEADTDNWRQMVEVNLLGLMNATHAALPVMREQESGHVVNVSSVAGRQASATASGYNATKFGVNGFTEAFRQEVADDGIRTTLIEPGIVDTELQEHIPDDEVQESVNEWVESMEPLTGTDIARTIAFAVAQPQHVSVNELLIRPTQQE
jgi:NADP-dependent 3-hydroxy acid dehydrogenase YdfG